MEPRVPAASSRLKAIRELTQAGVRVSVLIAPIIPAINDNEIEAILDAVSNAGATRAHYIFLRLPHELREIFEEWLVTHFPDRSERVLSLIRQASGGNSYDPRFAHRQTGRGPYADMLAARFAKASRELGMEADSYQQSLDCSRFLHPAKRQLGLAF
jgi:DNA repair photolyase